MEGKNAVTMGKKRRTTEEVEELLNTATEELTMNTDAGISPLVTADLPNELFAKSSTVIAAQAVVKDAEERVVALETEQRELAQAQTDAREMAKDMGRFWGLQRRWSEIEAEIYVAKATLYQAQEALLDAKLAVLSEGVADIEAYISGAQAQIVKLQNAIAPFGNALHVRHNVSQNLRSVRGGYSAKLATLEMEWASKLRGSLPAHLRDSIKRGA